MPERTQFVTTSDSDRWSVLHPDFSNGTFPHDYHVQVQAGSHVIDLDVASSPGGGYEGGYGSTSIRAALSKDPGLVFVMYPEDFLNRIGKLFGIEDAILGYEELDRHLIVKTNNADRLKGLVANQAVRDELQRLSGFSFKIDKEDEEERGWYLELSLQRAVGGYSELTSILEAFYIVLDTID